MKTEYFLVSWAETFVCFSDLAMLCDSVWQICSFLQNSCVL